MLVGATGWTTRCARRLEVRPPGRNPTDAAALPTMQTYIDDKPFEEPVLIRYQDGDVSVGSVRQARDILASVDWPGPRDDLHETALDTCLKVLDGHRSTQDGRQRLVEAARAAGVYGGSDEIGS